MCVPYCPVEAISIDDGKATINLDRCVECGVCFRSAICPTHAIIKQNSLPYPRSLRQYFSDPTITKRETGLPGRGTEEVKTNDVTGRVRSHEVGFCVELGRPGVSASFKQVQYVTTSLAKLGVEFEDKNPVTHLMKNRDSGELKEEILDERILSVIVEFKTNLHEVPKVIQMLHRIESRIETVFTVGVVASISEDNTIPVLHILRGHHINVRPNAKINLGLGKR
jgi:ferredoxin